MLCCVILLVKKWEAAAISVAELKLREQSVSNHASLSKDWPICPGQILVDSRFCCICFVSGRDPKANQSAVSSWRLRSAKVSPRPPTPVALFFALKKWAMVFLVDVALVEARQSISSTSTGLTGSRDRRGLAHVLFRPSCHLLLPLSPASPACSTSIVPCILPCIAYYTVQRSSTILTEVLPDILQIQDVRASHKQFPPPLRHSPTVPPRTPLPRSIRRLDRTCNTHYKPDILIDCNNLPIFTAAGQSHSASSISLNP